MQQTSTEQELARIDALHTALTQVVLEGGELDAMAAEIARVLDLGVLVVSTDGRERAGSLAEGVRARMLGHGLLDASGRVRVERLDPTGTALGGGPGEVCSLRVVAAGTDLARLVAVRAEQPLGRLDLRALERAAALTAVLLTRHEAVVAVENKYQGDFLRDVFLGRAGEGEYVAEHARSLGWELSRPMVVMAAEIDPLPADADPVSRAVRRRWQERFATAWRQVTRSIDETVPCVDLSSEVVVLLPVPDATTTAAGPDAGTDAPAGEDVVRRVVAAVSGDRGGGRRPFTCGVSRVAARIEDLPEAYAQARRAVEVGRRVHGGATTTFFDQLGLHRLLALVPDTAELHDFAADVLGALAEDTTEATDLRETLQVLLDTNFNVAEAARTQFFHYNTMRYRVAKLERLLGPLSTDPHLRLDVAVALRVLEIAR